MPLKVALGTPFVGYLWTYYKTLMDIETRCGRKIHQILFILSHIWTINGVCEAFFGKILKPELKGSGKLHKLGLFFGCCTADVCPH